MGGTILPQFFGLGAVLAVNASGYRLPIEGALFENAAIDDQVGIGIVTGLRAYLGRQHLGAESAGLIPHRLAQTGQGSDTAFRVGGLPGSHQ
jgi:hypothetical protein